MTVSTILSCPSYNPVCLRTVRVVGDALAFHSSHTPLGTKKNTIITLVNVKAPVVATTNWWWLISALVVA